ncbi:hypothetical protein HN011_004993 [Eciton burchellii]|nr:hypothetical protein HN011_004993 [Eciton burchellii]
MMRALRILLTASAFVVLISDCSKILTGTDQQQWGNKSSSSNTSSSSSSSSNNSLPKLTVGLIVPYTSFSVREYTKAVNKAIDSLHKGHARNKDQSRFSFLDKYQFVQRQVLKSMMKLTPSPTGKYFCNRLDLQAVMLVERLIPLLIHELSPRRAAISGKFRQPCLMVNEWEV